MQVKADLSDALITLGNTGVSLTIADNTGKHVGTLRVGKATVEWRKGKTQAGNGKKIKLEKLIELLDEL
jgi:hypothetical protein